MVLKIAPNEIAPNPQPIKSQGQVIYFKTRLSPSGLLKPENDFEPRFNFLFDEPGVYDDLALLVRPLYLPYIVLHSISS